MTTNPLILDHLAAALGLDSVPSWHDDAACASIDPELWFPEVGAAASTGAARAVCAACPVRTECLTAALERGEQHGIWGGLTTRERRALTKAVA